MRQVQCIYVNLIKYSKLVGKKYLKPVWYFVSSCFLKYIFLEIYHNNKFLIFKIYF
jgi:hypothetical protein